LEKQFLPVSRKDMEKRGWDEADIILVSGDAYVDHPSFGTALIGRILESRGFRVGVIAQPDWRSSRDFMRLGRPRLFFAVSAGNVDSMVANYTANKKRRREDTFSPGNKPGLRPDRASIVYSNCLRQAFSGVNIVLGGIEASLRRLAHYDYWDDEVRRSLLLDAKADFLVYGMAETAIVELAQRLKKGEPAAEINFIRGTVVVRRDLSFVKKRVVLPSFEQVKESKQDFNLAFKKIYREQDPFHSATLVQKHGPRWVVHFPPALPLPREKLDSVYALPFTRRYHPMYKTKGGIKGLETVRWSLTSHRGCPGECAFCSIFFHQGRIVQSRSRRSLLEEARGFISEPDFKGTINDVGGPTANLYQAECSRYKGKGFCPAKKCLFPEKCPEFKTGYSQSLNLYRSLAELPGVRHVFIGSGFRYDLLKGKENRAYLRRVCESFISGQMKVAPEHSDAAVLKLMHKPGISVYKEFLRDFKQAGKGLERKCFLVNYFIVGHPGCSLDAALDLALFCLDRNMQPEQVQDFIPLPMTLSAAVYYTGKHPFTGEKIYTAKTLRERRMQRALLQYRNPKNKKLILEALGELGRKDLAGKFFKKHV